MNNKNYKRKLPLKNVRNTTVNRPAGSKVRDKINIPRQTIYLLLGIILLTVIAFSNSLKGQFLNWDDKDFIVENSFVKDFSLTGIKNIFVAIDKHDPIVALTHAFTYHYWGVNPVPYHVLNLLFHLLNIILVYIFILKLTRRTEASLIAAIFFAIHPLRVESVAWIAERKDVLYVFFYLASLITYIIYIKRDNKFKYIIFSLLLFICSLLSKLSAVTLPVVLLLINYYFERKITTKVIIELIPFFVLSFLRGSVHIFSNETISGNEIITQTFPLSDRIFLGSYALIFYLTSIFYFFNLSVLHPYPVKAGNLLPSVYYIDFIFALIFFALVIWLLIKNVKHKKDLVFAVLFFLLNISLVLHIVPFGGGIVVGDRYSYLPYVGVFFLFGQIFCWLTDRNYKAAAKLRVYLYVFLSVFLFLCFIVTFNRNNTWTNSLSLWSDAVEHFPEHFYGYYGVGNAKSDAGDYQGALVEYQKAIKLNPKFSESYYNSGSVKYNNLKDYQGAIPDFNKAIEINPNHITAYTNRGLTKHALKDYTGAMNDFNKALELNKNFPLAYNFRANLKTDMQDYNGAIEDYNRAIELNPNYAEAYNGRGIVYGQFLKQNDKAISDFMRELEINPGNAQAYMNMGSTKFFMNDLSGACRDWKKSFQLGNTQAAQLINEKCK